MKKRHVKSLKTAAMSALSRNKTLAEVMEECNQQDESICFSTRGQVGQLLTETIGPNMAQLVVSEREDVDDRLKEFCQAVSDGEAYGLEFSNEGHYYRSSLMKNDGDTSIIYGCNLGPDSVMFSLDDEENWYYHVMTSIDRSKISNSMTEQFGLLLQRNRINKVVGHLFDGVNNFVISDHNNQEKAYKFTRYPDDLDTLRHLLKLSAKDLGIGYRISVKLRSGYEDRTEWIGITLRNITSFTGNESRKDAVKISKNLFKFGRADLSDIPEERYGPDLEAGRLFLCMLNTKNGNIRPLGKSSQQDTISIITPGPAPMIENVKSVTAVCTTKHEDKLIKHGFFRTYQNSDDFLNSIRDLMHAVWKMVKVESSIVLYNAEQLKNHFDNPPHVIAVDANGQEWKIFTEVDFNIFIFNVVLLRTGTNGVHSANFLDARSRIQEYKLDFYIGDYIP